MKNIFETNETNDLQEAVNTICSIDLNLRDDVIILLDDDMLTKKQIKRKRKLLKDRKVKGE